MSPEDLRPRFLTTTDVAEILGMSDRIAVMHQGSVVATFERVEATQELLLERALGHLPGKETGVT